MKKICILLTLVFITNVALFAQGGMPPVAQEKRNLEKDLKSIEASIDPANPKSVKTVAKPATWIKRGEIFHAIFKDKNAKNLSADPLTESLNSYKKALELDTKGRSAQQVKNMLLLLSTDIMNQAVDAYKAENFIKGLQSFEQVLEINQLPVIKKDNPSFIDTAMMYNAGLCAFKSSNWDKAIRYLSEAGKYGYNIGSTTDLLKNSYLEKKDTVTALKVLQDAFSKNPDNNELTVSLTNYYIKANKTDEAVKYLKMAIQQDPGNPSFYVALGNLYEKLNRPDEALESYKKSVEINKDYHDGYYYIGEFYITAGNKHIDVANKTAPSEKELYDKERAEADVCFKKALESLEAAYKIKPDFVNTIDWLKNLYYRFNMLDKYEEMKKKLEK
jgi:tetratricopeptide (TPR) repeat protein